MKKNNRYIKKKGGIDTPNKEDSIDKLIDEVINKNKNLSHTRKRKHSIISDSEKKEKTVSPTRKRKHSISINKPENNTIKLVEIDPKISQEKGELVEKPDAPYIEVVKDKNIMEDFVELSVIGRGGFGVVCTIKNKNDPNCIMVAKKIQIKRIKTITMGDPPQVYRKIIDETYTILNEIHILNKLKDVCSKYILCFNDFYLDKDNNIAYIVTEYLQPYKPLSYYIRTAFFNKTVSVVKSMEEYGNVLYKIAQIISNMIKGLALIHSNNIVHRDIKPDNILIDIKSLDVKYIDFGLACDKDMNDKPCEIMGGTPIYIDPYYFIEKKNDLIKIDYWELGCSIFEIFFLMTPMEYYYYKVVKVPYLGLVTCDVKTIYKNMKIFHEKFKSNLYNADKTNLDTLYKLNIDLIQIAKNKNLAYIDFQNIFLDQENRELYGI
jgi:serine/threonine protein kinase